MAHWYTNRDMLKRAFGMPDSATADHAQLDAVIEAVSRSFERHTGRWFYPKLSTLYFSSEDAVCLPLPGSDLLEITALAVDASGVGTYDSSFSASDYYLKPYNARELSPPEPYWVIETKPLSSAYFPVCIERGVRITGKWGYYDEHESVSAYPKAAVDSTQKSIVVQNCTAVHPGQTLLVGSEQVFISEVATSSGTSGTLSVKRGQEGTTATSYASGQALEVYRYPLIERLALYQAQQDFRAKDAPMGFSGGARDFQQQMRPGAGGLHPFVARELDHFRKRTVV